MDTENLPGTGHPVTKSSPAGATVPAMGTIDDRRWVGNHGTDVSAYKEVQAAVTRLVRKQWGGWSASDREDLEQLVMVKYFGAFGRERLPNGRDGEPGIPISWLMKVVKTSGIDFHRQKEARPADPVDFQDPDSYVLERLQRAANPRPNLSAEVAQQVDLQRGLEALGDANPLDVKLIVWRYVEDRSLDDIGQMLGKTPDATRKATQRAVKRFRELIAATSSSLSTS